MMATVHIYYTVEQVADAGQGFRPQRETLATFEYKHEAQEYAAKYEKEHNLLWGYIEVREHIER